VIHTLVTVLPVWRRGRLSRQPYPVTQTRKNQTTTKPRRLLMTQLSWQTEGRGKNPFPDVSIDVEIKNQIFRRTSPDWRLFLTWKVFHFYDKQRTVLPSLGVDWPVWDVTENHDAIEYDVIKRSSANAIRGSATTTDKEPCFWFRHKQKKTETSKQKCADINALRSLRHRAPSPCICIHINMHTVWATVTHGAC